MKKQTKKNIVFLIIIFGFTLLIINSISNLGNSALNSISEAYGTKCEKAKRWYIQEFSIQEYKCLGIAGPSFIRLKLFKNDELILTGGQKVDSCKFNFLVKRDLFLKLNLCKNEITELKPEKEKLTHSKIDSAIIYSNVLKQTKKLNSNQIQSIVSDWNNSKIRGYSDEPFDSAFYYYPAYQYKMTFFCNSTKREFYGYNYLILDSTRWKYEMDENGNLEYFNEYWNESKLPPTRGYK